MRLRASAALIAGNSVTDDFAGTGALIGYTTNNEASLPDVQRRDGRYVADLQDNTGDITLHYNNDQGRLDAKQVTFPFTYVAYNIGIGTSTSDTQTAPSSPSSRFLFCGVQVHALTLAERTSAHVVVGHRGNTDFTVEGKNTVNTGGGTSQVDDAGANVAPLGRMDIKIEGLIGGGLRTNWLRVSYRQPGETDEDWVLYGGDGLLPGNQSQTPDFASTVYIGLITYAQGTTGVPFVGTCDGVELVS